MKLRKLLLAVLLTCSLILALGVVPAAAAAAETQSVLNYDVYMQLEGIEGESAVRNYEKWIVLTGVQFDAANVSSSAGGGGGAGKATFNQFIVTKQFDSSSVPLFMNTLTGKHMKTGKIVFVSRGKSASPFLTIELSDVVISNYDFNNANETIGLSFGQIQLIYSATDAKGTKIPQIKGGFDLKQNKAQ